MKIDYFWCEEGFYARMDSIVTYSYPTSDNWQRAKKDPETVARESIQQELRFLCELLGTKKGIPQTVFDDYGYKLSQMKSLARYRAKVMSIIDQKNSLDLSS